jgi:hypothetical protein
MKTKPARRTSSRRPPTKTSQSDDESRKDIAYWRRRPTWERLALMWALSCEAHGVDPNIRMDRSVVRIRKLKPYKPKS